MRTSLEYRAKEKGFLVHRSRPTETSPPSIHIYKKKGDQYHIYCIDNSVYGAEFYADMSYILNSTPILRDNNPIRRKILVPAELSLNIFLFILLPLIGVACLTMMVLAWLSIR